MSNKGGYSREGLFGTVYHYDAKGHKIGESRPSFFGGYNNYDAKGHKVGESRPGFFGGYTNYDAKGHKTGSVSPELFGSQTHYDAKGHRIGSTDPGFLGDQTHSGNFGNDAGIINNAGGAAGIRRDERAIMTAIGIDAAGSAAASTQKVQQEWSDADGLSSCSSKAHVSQQQKDQAPSSTARAKTARYIIARSSDRRDDLYIQTDEEYKIGDLVVVEGTGEQIQVLETVECLEEALPPEATKGFRVRAL